MQIKTGIDLVEVNKFEQSVSHGKQAFVDRVFNAQEQRENSISQLASIFAVKEACIKALEFSQDSWLTITTTRKDNGKVAVSFLDSSIASKISSLDASISHDGEYIIAVVVIVKN